MSDKYEDPFVKISYMIGGDEYLKVARSLLKSLDATDEEIALGGKADAEPSLEEILDNAEK